MGSGGTFMSDYPIEVENLTKIFKVLHRERSLKSAVLKWARFRFPQRQEFAALKDITLRVPKGQAIGIIGRNGSGKSTLLTLLAGIYRPTSGSVQVRGRIASLLELGAGFHPEFTGLENIYLNGAILGMPRALITERLETIIQFADLEEFIDTKIKFYSSGMIARLGFAVAVHVDPEVLLVDEVLAVGDANFHEKCYAKIDEFKRRGVTIFFVSHDLDAVKRVCNRVIWIDHHEVREDGNPEEVIAHYEKLEIGS
jgi:ABC-type polysaccharide/polyol phosphate transport system ATPase subunit